MTHSLVRTAFSRVRTRREVRWFTFGEELDGCSLSGGNGLLFPKLDTAVTRTGVEGSRSEVGG